MQALLGTGLAEAQIVLEPSEAMREQAMALAPAAQAASSMDMLLASDVDGMAW